MNSAEIRRRFLEFFENKRHAIIPSAPLITADEKGVTNSTLFNTAGMQPLIPYLLGQEHPFGKRLANVQKCLRTVDIDEVGDATHATFFEMLGNWSLGDYFKREAINWSYEFLTLPKEGLGLDPNRLYVTVFEGDKNARQDNQAAEIWREIFRKNNIDENRIYFMPADKNWWEAGENGPCGPDSEMYYDVKNVFNGRSLTRDEFIKADDARQVIEIWNDVFMQYEKKDGKIIGSLPKPSVDTGAGLERLTMTMQDVDNIYDTDLLQPTMVAIQREFESTIKGNIDFFSSDERLKVQRMVADHIRASIFLISDGVAPSNTARGYILRRLIRKAVGMLDLVYMNLNLSPEKIKSVIDSLIDNPSYKIYPELEVSRKTIVTQILGEADRYLKILGSQKLERVIEKHSATSETRILPAETAFKLVSEEGYLIDTIKYVAISRHLHVDLEGYGKLMEEHKNLSRAGAEKKFKGGLADTSDEMVVRYHTATHLLHQALHDVLGENANQKGSNITNERLRFDFSHGAKMTDEEKKQVEEIVNKKIEEKLPVNQIVLTREEAEKTGARHFFGEKYGDQISVYFIGSDMASAYSKEFCGGPHVKNTGELAGPDGKWRFKIAKEEAVSQGVRRIKAILQDRAKPVLE